MAQERNGSISKLVIEYPSTNQLTYDASSGASNTDEDAGDEDEPPLSGLQQQTRRKSELSVTIPAGRKGSTSDRSPQQQPPPAKIRRSSSITARLRNTFLPTTDYDIATPASAMYQPIDEEMDSSQGDPAGEEEEREDASFWKRNRGLFLIATSQLFFSVVWVKAKRYLLC